MKRILPCILLLVGTQSFAQTTEVWKHNEQTTNKEKTETDKKFITLTIDKEYEKTVAPLPASPSDKACHAEVSTIYNQRNDKVQVEAEINNNECDWSYGNYIVRLKTANEEGVKRTVDHKESWSIENSSYKAVEHSYSMDGDVELISARIRGSAGDFCKCRTEAKSAAPDQDATPDQETE